MQTFDINFKLPIKCSVQHLFEAITTPQGLDHWWTKNSQGRPELGSLFELDFGFVQWQAQVTQLVPPREFELTMTRCDPNWLHTTVSFEIEQENEDVSLKFSHCGWPRANHHYLTSNYCWAMYLRILKRYMEHGEQVPYEDRLLV